MNVIGCSFTTIRIWQYRLFSNHQSFLNIFNGKQKKEVEQHIKTNKDEVQNEIADIAMYLFELADNLGIDLIMAMEQKLKKNSKKYPIAKARGSNLKYNKL